MALSPLKIYSWRHSFFIPTLLAHGVIYEQPPFSDFLLNFSQFFVSLSSNFRWTSFNFLQSSFLIFLNFPLIFSQFFPVNLTRSRWKWFISRWTPPRTRTFRERCFHRLFIRNSSQGQCSGNEKPKRHFKPHKSIWRSFKDWFHRD